MRKLVAALVIVSLCFVLVSCNYNGLIYDNYENSDDYLMGGALIKDEIASIYITWLDGSVDIVEGDTEGISFSEISNKTLNEYTELRYFVEGNNLYIEYMTPGLKWVQYLDKKLTLIIPHGNNLRIIKSESLSADVTLDNISVENIDVTSTSGSINVSGCTHTKSLNLNSTSGDITFLGDCVESADINSTSGKITVNSSFDCAILNSTSGHITFRGQINEAFDVNTTSGFIDIYMPEFDNMTISVSTKSGKITSDALIIYSLPIVSGDGEISVNITSTSGNINITDIK